MYLVQIYKTPLLSDICCWFCICTFKTFIIYIITPKILKVNHYLKKDYQYLQTDKIMIYISCLIDKNSVKYNFGRACRLNKIKKDFIPLPMLNDKINIDMINKISF